VGGEIVLEPEPEPIGGSPDSESPPEMQEAPEPATLLTGLIGMSAAGAFALRRRRT
jgi:MYXO-CTERM domain-containing protein